MTGKDPGYLDFVKAAFHARPSWLFVPPNWIGLAFFAAMGFANPGFWLLGLGLELAYLHQMAANPRFQNLVRHGLLNEKVQSDSSKLDAILKKLDADSRAAHLLLKQRCSTILGQLKEHGPGDISYQRGALDDLLWIHLRLLQTKNGLERALGLDKLGSPPPLQAKGLENEIRNLEKQISSTSSEDIVRSLNARLELLRQRENAHLEGRDRILYLDSELSRIAHQVEWIGEQSMLSNQRESISGQIDQVAGSFQETNRWLSENQKLYGEVEDLLETAPSILQPEPPQAQ